MPVWRLQTSVGGDSPDQRDRFVITPHINDQDVVTTPGELCTDWAAALDDWMIGATRQIEVTAYDAQGSVPVFPAGHAIVNEGAFPPSQAPREVAVCLSFYAERNLPRQRGRLYIPAGWMQSAFSIETARPTTPMMTKVGDLAQLLADLGGTGNDWSVYSRVDDEARAVSNWYVDNEWDTIRSRGLRPTERVAGTVDES